MSSSLQSRRKKRAGCSGTSARTNGHPTNLEWGDDALSNGAAAAWDDDDDDAAARDDGANDAAASDSSTL